ncbi:MAG: hypothetical protein LBT19_03165 [Candidatus Nomurabacteria bacterium]|nr:hypothetical protein [Candidatus Nomurabacteria bacterium]
MEKPHANSRKTLCVRARLHGAQARRSAGSRWLAAISSTVSSNQREVFLAVDDW